MSLAVIVPIHGEDPHRVAAWRFLRWTWRGWVQEGRCPSSPFVKAEAVERAVRLTDASILIVADADVRVAPDRVHLAVQQVASGRPWAIPHGDVYRLSEAATAKVYETRHIPDRPTDLARPRYRGFAGGGVVVVRREVYEDCPLDPRFVGWGQEDESWAMALTTLHGPAWRGTAPLVHLWHPPADRLNNRWGSPESKALAQRYRSLRAEPEQMRVLVDEARQLLRSSAHDQGT